MNNDNPAVSVFIPYYNDRKFLEESIQSVLNQSYTDFELILLNHATKDNCREIAHSFNDSRIKHINMAKNLGAGSGCLILEFLKLAKGKYVKLFCADDIMSPDGLEKLVGYMEGNPEVDFAFGNVDYIDENEKSLNETFFNQRPFFSTDNTELDCMKIFILEQASFLPYIGSIVKREVINSITIDQSIIMLLDMSIWLSIFLKGGKIGYLNEIIGGYRIHEGQMSALGVLDLALKRSYYECVPYRKLIHQHLTDVPLAKKIFSKSKYINKLERPEDISFIIYQHYLNYVGCQYSYSCLHDMLEDDAQRENLEKRFGYGIRQFRKDYSKEPEFFVEKQKEDYKKKPGWKLKLHSTSINDLGLFTLLYLVFRKTYFIITFRKFFKKRKKVKEKSYSL